MKQKYKVKKTEFGQYIYQGHIVAQPWHSDMKFTGERRRGGPIWKVGMIGHHFWTRSFKTRNAACAAIDAAIAALRRNGRFDYPVRESGDSLIIDELCTCGALRTEHLDTFDSGRGACPRTDCRKFTWSARIERPVYND